METRSEHMGPVGTTADILEAQQKEQKVRVVLSISIKETLGLCVARLIFN